VAHFDKAIPPGGEGKIKLRVTTKGYQGSVHKSAKVYHNDPNKEVLVLKITANVKVPIYLSSRYVSLYGKEGQSVTRVVDIKAELDKPLKLSPVEFNLSDKLSYTIEEIEKGKKFRIRFKSIPGPPQTYTGFLKIKTNYPEKPEITVRIRGRIGKKS
jgi:hypothetical protein